MSLNLLQRELPVLGIVNGRPFDLFDQPPYEATIHRGIVHDQNCGHEMPFIQKAN